MDPEFFPLSFWYPPEPTLADYKLLADCGFNLAPLMMPNRDAGRQMLDLAEQVGIKVLALDYRLYMDLALQPDWLIRVCQVVEDYYAKPALWGYFVADEPHAGQFSHLAEISHAFRSLDLQRVPFINLYPNFADTRQLGCIDYQAYVRTYLEIVHPDILCYDHFNLMEWGDRPGYFANLELIRAEAARAGLRFMQFVLSTPHYHYRAPTAEDLQFQVYSSLAYGATGLGFFTYKPRDVENYGDGIVTLYGHPTERYYQVQQLLHEVTSLAPWLLRLRSRGVYHFPPINESQSTPGTDSVIIDVETPGVLVGEFEDPEGARWLLVMNKDRQHSVHAKMRLAGKDIVLYEVARAVGKLRRFNESFIVQAGGAITELWLAPADARLLCLKNNKPNCPR